MSVQAITWALEQTVGSPTGKIILLCLANYADKNGACFPGHKTIADECEVSVRSVAEWMAKLESLGLIDRTRRFRNNGSRTSDSIVLRLPWLATTTSSEPHANSASGRETASPHADDRTHQVQQVHPLNRQNNQYPPNPPSGGLDFDLLWKAWPTEHQGNRENATAAWSRLTPTEQATALRNCGLAVRAFALRHARIPALVMYLRNRVFDEFDGAPPIDGDGYFVIKPGMPEWSEWLGWIRRTHGERYVEQQVVRGVFFSRDRWPAKAGAQSDAA